MNDGIKISVSLYLVIVLLVLVVVSANTSFLYARSDRSGIHEDRWEQQQQHLQFINLNKTAVMVGNNITGFFIHLKLHMAAAANALQP
jgi:sarcosine oxidase delta subunit